MKLFVIGLGPGHQRYLTAEAREALDRSEAVVGYPLYLDLIRDLLGGKRTLSTPMRKEEERCRMALETAAGGTVTALVCSGDSGVYGMAALVWELSPEYPEVEVLIVPGISAALSAAALLGAPLTNDFAVISLSDLLTPWDEIERRLSGAASGGLVICLYNPASTKRRAHLERACDIILKSRPEDTVCGVVRNVGREGESSRLTTLGELRNEEADMFTTVIIGNPSTLVIREKMITPRGYRHDRKAGVHTPSAIGPPDAPGCLMRLFVFAGTADGRFFIEEFQRAAQIPYLMRVFTATEYGKDMLSPAPPGDGKSRIEVLPGRLDAEAMYREMVRFKPAFVVDCTHPYAGEAGRNIQDACERARCGYLRLRREPSPLPKDVSAVYVDSLAQAAGYLQEKKGNILVTTGSKDLESFRDKALRDRVFLRVLPLEESIEKCRSLGFPSRNIIAMQGPFSEDLNRALIRQFHISWLVTKDSGSDGGCPEKFQAARREGIPLVLVRRPREEEGRDLREILEILLGSSGTLGHSTPSGIPFSGEKPPPPGGEREGEKKRWFPAFLDLSGTRFLVVGGGKIALRRVLTLLRFDCALTILSQALSGELRKLAEENPDRIEVWERPFSPGDCGAGMDFVLALTDKREVNRRIAQECRERGIPVSVADYREDSTFYFPAVVSAGDLVIGLSSGGKDHRLVRGAAEKVRRLFEAAEDSPAEASGPDAVLSRGLHE